MAQDNKIFMNDLEGKTWEVPSSNAQRFLDMGWTLMDGAQSTGTPLSDAAKGAALGLAKGVSLGLSDRLLAKPGQTLAELSQDIKAIANPTGLVQDMSNAIVEKITGEKPFDAKIKEELQAKELAASVSGLELMGVPAESPETAAEIKRIRESSPIASGVGEVAGILTSPIGGALGKGAARISTGLLSKLTSGSAKGLEKVAEASLAAGSAGMAEGAAVGLTQAISEEALGDAESVGENVLAHVGWGAVYGGLGGALLGGTGALGGQALSKGIKVAEKRLSQLAKKNPNIFEFGKDAALGGALGASLGSPVGAAGGVARAAFKQWAKTAAGNRQLQKALETIQSRLDKGLRRLSTSRAPKISNTATALLMRHTKQKNPKNATKAMALELHRDAAEPDQLIDRVSASLAGMEEFAPNIATSMTTAAMKGFQTLQQAAPKPPPEVLLQPKTDWFVSDDEAYKFSEAFYGVSDPVGVVEEIMSGTASPIAVRAMQATYGKFLDDVTVLILQEVALNRKKIAPRVKAQLSSLLGIPLDPLDLPSSIARSQGLYSPPGQGAGQGPQGVRFTGLDNLDNIAKQYKTETQKIGGTLE